MARESLETWAGIRTLTRNIGGRTPIRLESLEQISGSLPKPLGEMADDIAGWFKIECGCNLADVTVDRMTTAFRATVISPQLNMTATEVCPDPDDLTVLTFRFSSDCLPLRRARVFGQPLCIDLRRIFTPSIKDRVEIQDENPNPNIALVSADNVGSIYPWKKAIERLDCPYFLGRDTLLMGKMGGEGKIHRLSVMVTLADLQDTLSEAKQGYETLYKRLMANLSPKQP